MSHFKIKILIICSFTILIPLITNSISLFNFLLNLLSQIHTTHHEKNDHHSPCLFYFGNRFLPKYHCCRFSRRACRRGRYRVQQSIWRKIFGDNHFHQPGRQISQLALNHCNTCQRQGQFSPACRNHVR